MASEIEKQMIEISNNPEFEEWERAKASKAAEWLSLCDRKLILLKVGNNSLRKEQ